ncbi:MAG: prephenate dehydrogenase [Anaerolineae bacterium]
MLPKRVCIVGLGLIGGSLARALRPFLAYLAVVDANPDTRRAAGSLADLVTADLAEGMQGTELIILATPVRIILKLLAQLPAVRPDGCLVLDLGSTKAVISQVMETLPPAFQAIGGHPMCGKETSGFAAADPDLFQKQTFVLCRNGRTSPDVEQVAREIIDRIGAFPLLLPPDVHDRLVAATSHLPYLISAALMRTVAGQADDQLWAVSASGFRDTSRLAGSEPQMMLDILLTNRMEVIDQVDKLQGQLITIKRLLLQGDEAALADWLAETQQQYATYRTVKQKQ